MQTITCLADILSHVPRVRVIKMWDENYGKEFDIAVNDYENKLITISCPSLAEYEYDEIQFLTPVQYEWRYIGLGDKVNWYEVFGSCWFGDSWNLNISKTYLASYLLYISDIETFEPLNQLTGKIELSTDEMIAELKKRWVVIEGKIINN